MQKTEMPSLVSEDLPVIGKIFTIRYSTFMAIKIKAQDQSTEVQQVITHQLNHSKHKAKSFSLTSFHGELHR